MSLEYSENILVQQAAADILEQLGWQTIFAYNEETLGENGTLGRKNHHQVILSRYLKQALFQNNDWMTEEYASQAEKTLIAHSSADSLLQTNRQKHDLIKNGIPVDFKKPDGTTEKRNAAVINYAEPHKNTYIAVRELKIWGEIYRRRADIIGFVNGIPLVFIELKKQNIDIINAYNDNYTDYQAHIPQLFYYNEFVILANGIDAKIGTLGSKYEYFQNWKRLSENDIGRIDLETLLIGTCKPENILDLIENFILYDTAEGKTTKILARNHQYLGVNEAVEAYKNRRFNNGKLGVFWHTQGSGKSYSMIFFSEKIRRKLKGSPTFVIVTDREELNRQIGDTYENCGCLSGVSLKTVNPPNGEALIELLKTNTSYIFTLIQKFHNPNIPPIIPDHDIIIISDEAHRTQNGLLAENMANILPTAAKIGFTGTPLLTYDEITKRTFGDYVSVYDFKRAVEDGATVPLYYENRADKLGIQNPEITNELLDAIEQNDLDEKERARLERDLKREYHLLTSKKRLNTIAKDFVEHYTQIWTTGKAMFVCLDKVTAVKMHDLVRKYWDEHITSLRHNLETCESEQEELELSRKLKWMTETEMAVVISEEQNEQKTFEKYGLDIIPHRRKLKERNLEKEFKDQENPFRIVFVCAMWLTGFDVKCLSVLYLDKPLKAHTLMQTIARANRVNEGKTNGLIVAYADIVESLKRALADYANSGNPADTNPLLDKKELIAKITSLIAEITAFLHENGFILQELIDAEGIVKLQKLAAVNAVCTTDDTRKHFEILARELFKLFKYTEKGDIDRETYRKKNAISAIYDQLHVKSGRSKDYIDLTVSLQKIIDNYIEIEPADKREVREYNISMIDFERLAAKFKNIKNKNLLVKDIREIIEDRMEKLLKTNPMRIDYYEHYKQIIEEYNKDIDKTEIEKTFLALTKLVQELDEEEQRFTREGFENDEELAIYDLLRKDELSTEELTAVKKLSKELLDKIKEKIQTTNQWREKEETVAELRNLIRKQLYTALPESYSIERINCYSDRVFDHIYSVYPAA